MPDNPKKLIVLGERARERHRKAADIVLAGLNSPTPKGNRTEPIEIGFHFQNVSGETIPSYALMMLDGSDPSVDADEKPVLKLKKYDGTKETVFINGSIEIEASDYGFTQTPRKYMTLRMADDPTSVTAGTSLGPESGQFTAAQGGVGFEFVCPAYSPDCNVLGIVRVVDQLKVKVGLLTSTLAQPSGFVGSPTTATGQPYRITTPGGTPTTSGDGITLHNYHPSISGSVGDYFVAVWMFGMWYIIDVQCTPA